MALTMLSILAFVTFTSAEAVVLSAEAAVLSADHFGYRKQALGEFQPPEIPHLDQHPTLHGSVPPPQVPHMSLLQVGEDPAGSGAGPGLRPADNPLGSKVPANWFGRGVYTSPAFEIASGKQQTSCRHGIQKAHQQHRSVRWYQPEVPRDVRW